MTYCVHAGGCFCRCRDKKTGLGCATFDHCGNHGRKCHVNCRPKHPGRPPKK
jgi:hypothetical protein